MPNTSACPVPRFYGTLQTLAIKCFTARFFAQPRERVPDFYSIGLIGAPVIPIHIDTSDPRVLILNVSLKLQKNVDFTFEKVPCLIAIGSIPICPSIVEVSAIALYQDDGSTWEEKKRRWHKISQFYDLNSVHPEMANLPDIFVALKILSSEYQPLKFPKFITPPYAEVLPR